MKNNSSAYQKLFSSFIPKEFPEVYGLRIWTRKGGLFSYVYIIDVYLKPNADINCKEYVIDVGAKMESLLKYFEARERLDVRIHDSKFNEICRDQSYPRTSDTGPW